MTSIVQLRRIQNWILGGWAILVMMAVLIHHRATSPEASGRLLRDGLAMSGQTDLRLILLLGVIGGFAIVATSKLIQWSISKELRRYVSWAEEVSNRRVNQPIPKLGVTTYAMTAKHVSLDGLHEKLSKGINQLEFRYQQLLDERVRTADALRGMREGIIALDSDLELLLINEAGQELLNVHGPVRIGKPLVELIRQPQVLDLVRTVHANKKSAESVLQIGSGVSRLLRLRVSPLSDPQIAVDSSEVSGVMVLVSDVTRLTKLESMRRDFTANVSHELKTPLAAIQAYAETLLDGGAIDDPEANRRFVEGISKQADRLSALIHDLLQLARLDAEPEHVSLADVDLVPIVDEVLHEHLPQAEARGIDLRLVTDGKTAMVFGTEEGIRAIANNLISNAIRYNKDHGFVHVSITAMGAKTVLSVVDNGVGIAADQHDRVFERFYRVDKARSIDAGGTGLGLAIVKHLVLQMGGAIALQSKLGEGSRFEVSLRSYPGSTNPLYADSLPTRS